MPSLPTASSVMNSPEILSFFKENGKAKLFDLNNNVQYEQGSQNFTNFRLRKAFHTQTYLVNFNELFSKSSQMAVPGIDNLALLHASSIVYNSSKTFGPFEFVYMEICMDVRAFNGYTKLALLSVEDAKEHCFSNLKLERNQMKKNQAGSGNNDEDGSSEEDPLSYLGPYKQLQSLRESLEDVLDAETFNSLYTHVSQVLNRMDKLKEFFEKSDQSVLRAQDIPDDFIGIEARLIGCVTYVLKKESIEVCLLSVREAYQGCGVGRSLMEHVKDLLGPDLYKSITLTSVRDAIPFYRKLGWKSVSSGRYSDMILRWNDGESTIER